METADVILVILKEMERKKEAIGLLLTEFHHLSFMKELAFIYIYEFSLRTTSGAQYIYHACAPLNMIMLVIFVLSFLKKYD